MEQRRLKPSLSTKRKAPFVAAYSSTKRRRQQPAPGGFPAAAATVSKHKLPYSNPTKPTKVTNSGNTNERKPPLFSRYADPSVQSPKPIKNKYNTIAKTVASRQSMEPQEVDLSTLLDITRLETVEGDEILNTMLRVGKPRGLRQFPAEELLTNCEQQDRETLRRRRQKLRLQYSMMKEDTNDARIRQSLVPKAPDIAQDCAFQTQETDERARLEEEEAETDEESTESKIHRLSTAMHLKWRQCWRWFVSGAFLLCVVVMTAPLIEQILAPPLPFCDSDWIEAFDESFGVVASPDDFDRSKALAPFLQTTLTRKCQPCPVYGNCLNGSVISCGHPYVLKYQTCLENPVAQKALNELAQAMQAFIAKKATEIVCNTSSFSNSLYERDLFHSRRHESVTVPVLLSDVQKFVSSTILYAKAVSMLPSTYVFHRALDLALRDLEHVSVTEDQTQLLVSEHVVPWSCRATRRLYAHIKVIALAMALGTMLVFGYRHFLLCRIERQVVDRFVKEVRYFLLDRTRSFDCSYSSDQLRDDLFKKQSVHDRAWLTTCVWPQVVAIVNRDARIRTRILKKHGNEHVVWEWATSFALKRNRYEKIHRPHQVTAERTKSMYLMSCPHPVEASRSCLDTPLYCRPHESKCLSSCHVVATFDSDASNTHLDVVKEDALRRKFALYGRQHAHINHLTRIQQETTAVLQSTMLLQEEGVLAAKLDHITYLLDGLLLDSYKAPRAHVAHNRSILELTQLIQEPQILQAITLSSQRCRVKQLLVKRLQNDVMTRLSVAVLVYFLASSVDADEYIDHYVSRAIVDALVLENEAKTNDIGTSHETVISMPTSSLKRCLKRKQSVPKCANPSAMVSSTQVLDTLCQMKLDKLLQDHDVFYAGNELQITVSTALCAALYKLLQVDESTSFNERLSCQDRMKNFAVNTLETRKQELLQLGGLDFFMQDLVQHVYRLESGFLLSFSDGLTVECTRLLHLLSLSLRVLDQATFRMIPVQHYVCKHETVLTGVLTLIRMLSELSWGIDARRKWKTAPVQMFLCVDVLMLALRVALNLTHQNGHAAEQVHAQKGMQLLVQAFLKLSSLEKNSLQSWLRKKWQFDAELLLLTVMVNSIECSEDNRIALAEASVRQVEVLMAHDRVCDHFVQYFLSKVQSYKHLIDGTEADLISANDEWNPEDVILGGCTSLLLGYLMIDSMSNRAVVLKLLPDHTPRLLLRALAVFVAFYSQIGALTSDVAASALLVEKILKTCGESGIRDEDNEVLGVTAMKSNVTEIVPCFVKHSTCKALKPPALRNRVLKNVCSRLDDSDEENEVNMEAQQNGRSSRIDSEFESLTRDHSLLGWEQCRITPSVQTSVRTGSSEPRTRISSPVAVMPDGSMSSPVITRLLHQTRQLVREFDLNFATSSRLAYAKKADEITEREAVGKDNSSSYLCMVMTMDVTCRDSGHDSLDLKQDMGSAYTNDGQTNSRLQEMKPVTQTKRRKKVTDNCKVSAIKLQLSQDEISSSPFPLTPQRDNKSKVLLQTPPRAGRTPDMYRQSPLLHLTPTKSSPSTPLWIEKTSRLLQTPPKTKQASLVKESLLSHGRNRRKMKMVRAPTCARAASIFDFTD